MPEPETEKQRLCLQCLKCCKHIWIHTAFANDCLGAIEFYEARGFEIEPSDKGVLVIKMKHSCPHLTDKGCGIYEKRPYICKLYDGRKDHPDCKWHQLSNKEE
jgi:Fe-S-cluster containining protein